MVRNEKEDMWRIAEVVEDLRILVEEIEKHKEKLCLNIKTNQIISKYKPILSTPSHLPITLTSNNPHHQN